jgi:hypothetical protein
MNKKDRKELIKNQPSRTMNQEEWSKYGEKKEVNVVEAFTDYLDKVTEEYGEADSDILEACLNDDD